MTELDILNLFYNEMKARGITRQEVFISMNEDIVAVLSQTLRSPVSLALVHRLTDSCIANEWLERTTADPHYNYLSLTEAGLQVVLGSQYL